MQQFDVYANPLTVSRRLYPLIVCMQADLLTAGSERVVAPLAKRLSLKDVSARIAPPVRIDDD